MLRNNGHEPSPGPDTTEALDVQDITQRIASLKNEAGDQNNPDSLDTSYLSIIGWGVLSGIISPEQAKHELDIEHN